MGIVEKLRFTERFGALEAVKARKYASFGEAADLIERLRGYAAHGKRSDGEACSAAWVKGAECDCGLTALLKEIEGD